MHTSVRVLTELLYIQLAPTYFGQTFIQFQGYVKQMLGAVEV